MNDKLYLIGEFASINKVSTRVLRHYDKIGLLKPIVTMENGYRYYNENQIEDISKIKMLRNCEFLLEEISEILNDGTLEFLKEKAKKKIIELKCREIIQDFSIYSLKNILEENKNENFNNKYGISVIKKESELFLVSDIFINIEEIEEEFDNFFHFLKEKKLPNKGTPILLNYFDSPENQQICIGISVDKKHKNSKIVTLPDRVTITTMHYGDYNTIGYAYSNLIKYAEKNSYQISDFFIERYLVDSSNTINQNKYITEVSVDVKIIS